MTRERYFKMCEQLGQEPKEDEIPPDWEDFPELQMLATHYNNFHGYSGVNVIAVGTE